MSSKISINILYEKKALPSVSKIQSSTSQLGELKYEHTVIIMTQQCFGTPACLSSWLRQPVVTYIKSHALLLLQGFTPWKG